MKRKMAATLGIVAGLAVLNLASFADAGKFVAKHNGWSRATFESDAPIESIVGVTTRIDAALDFDAAKPFATAKGKISIDVAGFRTGIKMRDEHLRSKMWLDAESHPKIEFELIKVSSDASAFEPMKYVKGTAHGKLTIKGKTLDVEVPIKVGLFPVPETMRKMMPEAGTELLRISGRFKVKLSDYGVMIPSMLGMKVSDELTVRVDVTAASM